MKDYTYRDLTLEFLNTLHVMVMRGPQCQVEYISFYFQGEFYEFNLSTFNEIFGFPLSLDLSLRHVPCEFNPNVFRGDILQDFRYNSSS